MNRPDQGMSKPAVGFIGLGVMGRPIAERLHAAGFPLTVYNRTRSKAEGMVARGARLARSPAEAARETDVVITVVGDPEALESVALGPEGTVEAMRPGSTHIEMSTVSRSITVRLAKALEARGVDFLDAPVLGSGPQATEGNLIVMVGGRSEVLEKNRTLLAALGRKIVHTGEAGSASQLKLVANLFIASMMLGFAQAMALARKAGLSPELVMDVIEASGLRSPFYTGKLQRIRSRDFTPNFPTRWMLKDINLILEAGAELGVPLPGIAAAREIYVSAMAAGLADVDYSAVIEVLERAAGIPPGK